MRKFFIIVLLFPLLHLEVRGQAARYKSKWQLKASAGINLPLTKLLKGDLEDDLLNFDDKTFYWQFLYVAYFFHKHWGAEFNYQGATSRRIPNKREHFFQTIQADKGNDFFVTPTSSSLYRTTNIVSGDVDHGSLGLIYRLESDRFFLYPKVSIGVSSFYVDWAVIYLKERDANNLYTIKYSTSSMAKDHLCPSLSVAGGYKLFKNVFFNADLTGTYYKTNITIPVTTTDLNSGLETVAVHEYKKDIFTLGIGAGFIIVLK